MRVRKGRREWLTIEDLARRLEELGIILEVPEELPEPRRGRPPEAGAGAEVGPGPGEEGPIKEEVITVQLPEKLSKAVEGPEPGAGKERAVVRRLEVLITRKIGELRERHGDIMLYGDFLAAIEEAYASEYGNEVFLEDIEEAVSRLVRERIIAGVFTLGSGARIIRLSPEGFGKDELKVLEIASTRTPPELTVEELAREAGWPIAKARAVLESLEKAGIARFVPGSYTGGQDKWRFPGLERKAE